MDLLIVRVRLNQIRCCRESWPNRHHDGTPAGLQVRLYYFKLAPAAAVHARPRLASTGQDAEMLGAFMRSRMLGPCGPQHHPLQTATRSHPLQSASATAGVRCLGAQNYPLPGPAGSSIFFGSGRLPLRRLIFVSHPCFCQKILIIILILI